MEPLFEFPITLPKRGSRRLLRALHEQLRSAVLAGRLRAGARMPSTRALAAGLGVSRNTAVSVYEMLLGEGYLAARSGSGTFVADSLARARKLRVATATAPDDRRIHAPWRKPVQPRLSAGQPTSPGFNFRVGIPDNRSFPFATWRRLAARALRMQEKHPAIYADAQGQPALRAAIARHVSFARAVACEPEDIIVTSGAQQAFDLLARVLVTPSRTVVALENPGYPPARAAFAIAGGKLAHVPVDDEGLRVDRLPASARVIYVTPSHQFPMGSAMSMRRRVALLDFAHSRGAVIIEDDYDGEYRFDNRPLDALQTLDRAQSVFYVGTFSKSLYPALRVGYVVAPRWTMPALIEAKRVADWHGETITQDALAMFIAEGHLARHVRRMRQVYAQRRTLLMDTLDRDFSRWLEPLPSSAGLHLTARALPGIAVDAVREQARARGVGIQSLRPYSSGRSPTGLVFGYGAMDEDGIAQGLARLRRVFASFG